MSNRFSHLKFIFFLFAIVLGTEYSFGQSQQATITVKRKGKGVEVVESRTVVLNEKNTLSDVLNEMGVYNEKGEMIPGTEFMINIENTGQLDVEALPINPFGDVQNIPFSPVLPNVEEKAFLGVIVKGDEIKGNLGVVITEVVEASAASNSGLEVGDFIYKIDDTSIENHDALVSFIQSKKPNTEVKIFYLRNGKKKSVKATLGKKEMPATAFAPQELNPNAFNFDYLFGPDSIMIIRPENGQKSCDSMKICQPFSWDNEGFKTVQTPFLGVTPSEKTVLKGVLVGSIIPGSCAEKMGLIEGDVILEVNDIAVASFDDLKSDVQHMIPGSPIRIKVLRDGKEKMLSGELGHKSTSVLDDFRIYHDYKGMDENGNYNYDFELDMDIEDLEDHMKELFDQLKEDSKELADRLEYHYKKGDTKIEGTLIINDLLSDKQVPFSLSNRALSFEKLVLYPNDQENRLILEFALETPTSTEISILDKQGSRLYYELRGTMSNPYHNSIDFSTFSKGEYYLIISNTNGMFTKVIEKK